MRSVFTCRLLHAFDFFCVFVIIIEFRNFYCPNVYATYVVERNVQQKHGHDIALKRLVSLDIYVIPEIRLRTGLDFSSAQFDPQKINAYSKYLVQWNHVFPFEVDHTYHAIETQLYVPSQYGLSIYAVLFL